MVVRVTISCEQARAGHSCSTVARTMIISAIICRVRALSRAVQVTIQSGVTAPIRSMAAAATTSCTAASIPWSSPTVSRGDHSSLGSGSTHAGEANSLQGGAGSDTLYGGGGNDTLMGGSGSNFLVAGTGAHQLLQGAGSRDTRLYKSRFDGGRGHRYPLGGAGNDTIIGQQGDYFQDTGAAGSHNEFWVYGGTGAGSTLQGGAGNDEFHIETKIGNVRSLAAALPIRSVSRTAPSTMSRISTIRPPAATPSRSTMGKRSRLRASPSFTSPIRRSSSPNSAHRRIKNPRFGGAFSFE